MLKIFCGYLSYALGICVAHNAYAIIRPCERLRDWKLSWKKFRTNAKRSDPIEVPGGRVWVGRVLGFTGIFLIYG